MSPPCSSATCGSIPGNPQHDDNDRFVLSKGHAAPLLYAAWAEAGFVPPDDLLRLRQIDCDLEGHPTPRLPFVDVATGSLGQGICAAVGIALNARRIGSAYRTYVLIGDGESAEGSVWEAAQVADNHRLDNLCAITDVNGFGQSRATQWGHDMAAYRERWSAFGWHAIVVDGHDVGAILAALNEAAGTAGRPTMILARTLKGKGVSLIEGKDGWHGKPIKPGADLDGALDELNGRLGPGTAIPAIPPPVRSDAAPGRLPPVHRGCRPRRRTSGGARWRRGPPTEMRWPRSVRRTRVSWRSTRTSAIPLSVRRSRRPTATGSSRPISPSRPWSARRWDSPAAAPSRSPRRSPPS